eukprot:1183393-Prorocentrum_minimum.AAC.1
MSYLLPHLHSGWAVDQAILGEEDRLVMIRFGHDWDETFCYLVDTSEVPDFNTMYELYDPCTVMEGPRINPTLLQHARGSPKLNPSAEALNLIPLDDRPLRLSYAASSIQKYEVNAIFRLVAQYSRCRTLSSTAHTSFALSSRKDPIKRWLRKL